MKKRVLISLLLCLVMALALSTAVADVYENAILYAINDNVLEFNVVETAAVNAETAIKDNTAVGIASLADLTEALGVVPVYADCVPGSQLGDTMGQAFHADLVVDDGVVKSITIVSVNDRPVIGISWKRDSIGSDYLGFAEAYIRGGAKVLFLEKVTDKIEGAAQLAKIDGIFMTGGEDVNPVLYDEEAYVHGSSGWNDARDTSDIAMIQLAIENDVPLLGVCRGEQIFNVAMGGGLIQDIPSYLGMLVNTGVIDQSRVSSQILDAGVSTYTENGRVTVPCLPSHYRVTVDGLIHSGGTGYHALGNDEFLAIDETSKWMYDIAGGPNLEYIATAHHQAVNPEKLGNGLTIVAHSSDGIVEGIEYQDNLFALGVQFHPERDALGDTRSTDIDQNECNAFLGALIYYAGIYAANK